MRHVATTWPANGPPPPEAAALYPGKVMHARLKPFGHRFSYTVFTLLIDLDRLPEAAAKSWAFSIGRFNLLSFREADHGPRNGTPLRAHVDVQLAAHGLETPAARVLLLCYPRVFGFVFNPLSVYFAYDADDRLIALIYEVRNTFGDIHTYVEPVTDGQSGPEGIRQTRDKAFYVSPFLDMQQTYRFRILPPGEAVRVRILESDPEGPILSASFAGTYRAMTSRNVVAVCLKIPFMTLKVVAGIHWEALKLWWKGAPFHSPSKRPSAISRTTASPRA
jgi:DUF1365 family protein